MESKFGIRLMTLILAIGIVADAKTASRDALDKLLKDFPKFATKELNKIFVLVEEELKYMDENELELIAKVEAQAKEIAALKGKVPPEGPKKIPTVPNAFSYKSEIVQPASNKLPLNLIRTAEQWFDGVSKLFRMDVKPSGKVTNDLWRDDFGINPLSIVHDFNTGHAYIMDKVVGNCSIIPIKRGLDAAQDPENHNWVKMLDSSAFFGLTGANFTYQGTEHVGDVKVDVWTAFRTDWPPMPKTSVPIETNSWWTWKFLADEWLSNKEQNDDDDDDADGIPYQLELGFETLIGNAPIDKRNYTFNYYDFTTSAPLDWDFDIRPCWDQFPERAMLAISFPGKEKDIIRDNLPKVKEMFLFFVRIWGFIPTPVRVSEPRFKFKKDDLDVDEVIVIVEILGYPPIEGNVEPMEDTKTTLAESLKYIMDAVYANNFVIFIADEDHPDRIKGEVKATHGWYHITGERPSGGGAHDRVTPDFESDY